MELLYYFLIFQCFALIFLLLAFEYKHEIFWLFTILLFLGAISYTQATLLYYINIAMLILSIGMFMLDTFNKYKDVSISKIFGVKKTCKKNKYQ